MERQDGNATARIQTAGKISQKTVERREFIVHGNAQRLEDATNGIIDLVIHYLAQKGAADGFGQRGRRGKDLSCKSSGQRGGLRFIGIFLQEDGEVLGAGPLQHGGGGLTALRVHPHIERPREFDRETAFRIIKLHRRNAEVGKNHIGTGELLGGEDFGKSGEIAAVRHEGLGSKPERAQPRLRLRQLDGINVQTDETSPGLQLWQQFTRVAAVTQRAIHDNFARLRIQYLENLRDHDRPVRAGRRLAGSENFRDSLGVKLGITLLVFVPEAPRVFSGIACTPFMWRGGNLLRRRAVAHNSLYLSVPNRQSSFVRLWILRGGDAETIYSSPHMSLSNPQLRKLKVLAQRLDPVLHLGKAGLTDAFLAGVEQALNDHELIKIKFAAFKEERKSLTVEMATRTHSELVWIVGHVAVLYREQADPARRRVLSDV